ncbi:MAG: hypothetical protein Q8928_03340 [Bacteroidota bacterium]|nr:hypothetical protein [Bacteroidota bacterium]
MIYKDRTFEIDNNQIKFKNNTFSLFLIIYASTFTTSLLFEKGGILFTVSTLIGIALGFLFIQFLVGLYFKNNINLSDIEFVRVHKWDNSIDKNRNFWGTGRNKYHFPAGINKKKNPNVLLVHIKDRKSAVGFVYEDIEKVIAILKDKGIEIKTGTLLAE